MDREALVRRWFALTRHELLAIAFRRGWPIKHDHCFQRILLDNAVGGLWRDHIGTPAWKNASASQLATASRLGEMVLADVADLAELDARSLAWRGKQARLWTTGAN